ncbi:MAG: hypothetical protein M0011_00855 [Elusimicrobia bacterium]|nr:hypothetical protein [Elusimicrobiota bacterium]
MARLTAALTLAALTGVPAAAQQPPAASTAAVSAEIAEARRGLDLLQERGAEIPQDRIDVLMPQLKVFNAGLRAAIGDKILAEAAAREKEKEDRLLTENAVRLLQSARAALQVYYGVHDGKYPQDLAELVPDYLAAIPEATLPDHAATAGVKRVDSKKYDKDYPKAVSDEGGWLYFSDKGSQNYGLLLLNCSHTGPEGLKFYEY